MIKERHLKERPSNYGHGTDRGWLKRQIPNVGWCWVMWRISNGKTYKSQVVIGFAELGFLNEWHIAQRLRLSERKLKQAISRDGFTEEFHG